MKKVWLADPGHGGIDENGNYTTSGKRSPIWEEGDVYYEGAGNRDIVRRMMEGAPARGIEIRAIVDPNESKDVSLPARVNLANNIYKIHKNAVYISIHSNGFSKESAHGWSVYTSKGQTMSDVYAGHLFAHAQAAYPEYKMRKDTRDGDPDKEANFYVLRYTKMPSILSENFFHTNRHECRDILMTAAGRQKIADMHLDWMEHIDKHPTL